MEDRGRFLCLGRAKPIPQTAGVGEGKASCAARATSVLCREMTGE